MTRLLADENLDPLLIAWLRGQGLDAAAIADDRAGIADEEVLALAWEQQRFLITQDLDFGFLVMEGRRPCHDLLLLRLPTLRRAERIRHVQVHWKTLEEALPGNFLVLSEDKLRIRPLPK